MKSIKPGRGPSLRGGVVGICMIAFGVLWTVLAFQASVIFGLFGLVWTAIAVANTIYNFRNATGKNRYSEYDITDENEEPDPLNTRFGSGSTATKETKESRFCPYCGTAVDGDFKYCNSCGKKLP